MKNIYQLSIIFIALFAFNSNLFAHYIWIETESSAIIGNELTIKIYYGEFNEGLREIKGGRLEDVDGVKCWAIAPDGQKLDLKVIKQDQYYQAKFTPSIPGNYTIIAINKVREVMDLSKHGIGIVRPVYYSSKQVIVGDSKKTSEINSNFHPELVIIPYKSKDKTKPTFQLLYNNQPLPKTKLFVHAPNEWSKEFKTNDNGLFSFNPLWKGMYIIECIYKEKSPGIFSDKNYEAIRHRVTYTQQID